MEILYILWDLAYWVMFKLPFGWWLVWGLYGIKEFMKWDICPQPTNGQHLGFWTVLLTLVDPGGNERNMSGMKQQFQG